METARTHDRERKKDCIDSEPDNLQVSLYKHQPINLDRPAIRLLKLLGGHWSDEIQCNIFSGWFDEYETMIPYAALSYVWGSTRKTLNITIDNIKIEVTQNLHVALQYLRHEKEDRILWVDAICINQNNTHEKMHQIRQMGDIYKKAEEVIVWLGDGTDKTNFTMDTMMRLQEYRLEYGGDWRGLAEHWIRYQQLLIENFEEKVLTGMDELLQRSWFRRIWILQEIANARVATVHCGKFSVSARIFARFPVLLSLLVGSDAPFDIPYHCQSVLDIMPGLSRKESWWEKDRRLHTLLVKFRDSQATDNRDMIYALLGISSDAQDSDILYLGYDRPLRRVVQDTISFIIRKRHSGMAHTQYHASLYDFLDWTLPQLLENMEELNSVILGEASECGKIQLVRSLLGTDDIKIDLKDKHGLTPLDRAARKNHLYIMHLLIKASAERIFEDTDYNRKLLLHAVNSRDEICIGQLLERDSVRTLVLEAKDERQRTPLALAVRNGDTAIVRMLLEKGADYEAKDEEQRTPLFLAVWNGKPVVVQLLLDKGANYEAKDKDNRTPLSLASRKIDTTITNLLLEAGAKFPITEKTQNAICKLLRIIWRIIVQVLADILSWNFRIFRIFGPRRLYRVFGIWGILHLFLPLVVFEFRNCFMGRRGHRRN